MQLSLQAFLAKAPIYVRAAYFASKGLAHRRVVNLFARLQVSLGDTRGEEPRPGLRAGVKRWARYHRRTA